MDREAKAGLPEAQGVNEPGQSMIPAKHEEEFAADFAATPAFMNQRERYGPEDDRLQEFSREEDTADISRTWGWAALALAIVSLFVLPVFLGISAIVLGIIAYMRGTRTLGSWSVIIGGLAVLSYVVLIPTFA